MSLSRRDRAALTLALECLRRGDIYYSREALRAGGAYANEIRSASCWVDDRNDIPDYHRLAAGRLALLLRAALRADAGDFGPVHDIDRKKNYDFCQAVAFLPADEFLALVRRAEQAGALGGNRRIRPLWERAQAKPTRGGA